MSAKVLIKTFGQKDGQNKREFIKEVRELRESMTTDEYAAFVEECEKHLNE